MIWLVNLLKYFCHGTCCILWIFDTGIYDIDKRFWFTQNICHSESWLFLFLKFGSFIHSVLENFFDFIKMNLSSFIPKIWNRFILFFMSSCDIKLTINFRFDLNFWKKMLIASFELIEPFNCMLMNNIQTVVCSFVLCFSIICPFVCVWNID